MANEIAHLKESYELEFSSGAVFLFGIHSSQVLLVTDLFHPVDSLAVELFHYRDVRHGCFFGRTVPMFVTRRARDHGVVLLIPLSPLLIFGWGPAPAIGIAGGAIALLANCLLGSTALAAY